MGRSRSPPGIASDRYLNPLSVGLVAGGALHFHDSAASALAIVPSLLGMGLGTVIREHISATAFRRWFLLFLVLLGLELVIRPLI